MMNSDWRVFFVWIFWILMFLYINWWWLLEQQKETCLGDEKHVHAVTIRKGTGSILASCIYFSKIRWCFLFIDLVHLVNEWEWCALVSPLLDLHKARSEGPKIVPTMNPLKPSLWNPNTFSPFFYFFLVFFS